MIPQPSAGLQYPLTTQQALSLLGSGISVAGRVGVSGGEAMASKTTETVYEEQRVLREKCEYEYDTYKDEEVLKCRDEYVIEKVPVEKNVYAVDLYAPGRDISELTFSTPQKAIDQIVAYGATSWRRV
ncbi:hypothetical protein OHT59_24450 [Streptomyces sp. NBC_00243]|uniref:hypothetical protein n=1 Tax=Streptomyces sp. NBC_00243 TaxID=2975688 RepID=UPI002DD8FE76|nr:hypothetical protein [Streptomyces sp. NBC_00243]WRZ21424.1 hypothetical protein OHT59_24450 [Streptomyces sp. NBC_00243]